MPYHWLLAQHRWHWRKSEKDKAEIKTVVQSESDAWNRGDAEAFAAHYAENGSFTNVIGQQLYGRKAFIDQHARIFSTIYKGSRNTLQVSHVCAKTQNATSSGPMSQ